MAVLGKTSFYLVGNFILLWLVSTALGCLLCFISGVVLISMFIVEIESKSFLVDVFVVVFVIFWTSLFPLVITLNGFAEDFLHKDEKGSIIPEGYVLSQKIVSWTAFIVVVFEFILLSVIAFINGPTPF